MILLENKEKNFKIYPLDTTRWDDFLNLLGERGGCGGCWCMSWRLKKSDFDYGKGEVNKERMFKIVNGAGATGVLIYVGDQAVGWCSIAPREDFRRLDYSRVLKPVDDKPVWSIVCFFVDKKYRRQGLSKELIKGALVYAKQNGASIVEAYPVYPYDDHTPDAFLWTGIPTVFEVLGFEEVVRRSKWKPVMRFYL
ncbi:MAG: GNAT family N-acetyltransferase [Clostridia bacterium]|nr:GNAT family N-acetyltransferase [Clostridia bacterium]